MRKKKKLIIPNSNKPLHIIPSHFLFDYIESFYIKPKQPTTKKLIFINEAR